ncbi:MAG: type II secretion system F family protein, partial [Clostridiales bacterium]|nr:type II secretion system F family protein [Clostridiales bacterium]
MPDYIYTAVSPQGDNLKGEYSSPDKEGVVAMLRARGYYVIKVRKKAKSINDILKPRKVPFKAIARLSNQMASMLRTGIPVARTVEILKQENDHKVLKPVLEEIYAAISEGVSLSAALEPHRNLFPVFFIAMVEAGEASGNLDTCLERAGDSFSRTAKINSRLKTAMIYPAVILTVLFGLLLVMLLIVLPQFSTLYGDAGVDLPWFTTALLNLSDFVVANWIWILLTPVVLVILFRLWITSDAGRTRFDRFKTRAPLAKKISNKVYASRFARTLSALSSTGVSLPQALEVSAHSVVNRFLEKELLTMLEDINRGALLSTSMDRVGHLPPLLVSVTRVGEESGDLDEMLNQAADYFD